MNSPEIKQFIREHSNLFWYIPEDKKEEISQELLLETIFNYGDLDDIRRLIKILGIEKIAAIFFSLQGRKKLNYYPEIYNYCDLLLKKYARGNI
jgi:hypothetical protein